MRDDYLVGMNGGTLRGKKANNEKKPKQFPGGRICAQDGCSTAISRYNGAKFCWLHAPYTSPSRQGRRKKADADVRLQRV